MIVISPSTQRRLLQLPQIPSVWEGDRRSVSSFLADDVEIDRESAQRDCIVWVDGVEGIVRSMEMISSNLGPEAIVRNLLKAMEYPQGPGDPARPQKIVVASRETQFYLRGVLQGLNIQVDYKTELPLVDHLFKRFGEMTQSRPPEVPKEYHDLLQNIAAKLWKLSPWKALADHEILTVEINHWDVDNIHVCIMGMMGTEYGLLLYRSLDSLKRFRLGAVSPHEDSQMEAIFLEQDCIFITFDLDVDEDDDDLPISITRVVNPEPHFGNIHPLEGMRPFLYEEEALISYVVMVAVDSFFSTHRRYLAKDIPPDISKEIKIPLPSSADIPEINVKISTNPELNRELLQMMVNSIDEEDEEEDDELIQDDLIPENSLLWIGTISAEGLEFIRSQKIHFGEPQLTEKQDLPVLFIQTSRPKGKEMIEEIKQMGGIKGICFNPGEDHLLGTKNKYELGLIQLNNDELQFFGQYQNQDAQDKKMRKLWKDTIKKSKGCCGIMISSGVSGKSRGNPQPKDVMGFWEIKEISSKALGLGVLVLNKFDLDLDDDY